MAATLIYQRLVYQSGSGSAKSPTLHAQDGTRRSEFLQFYSRALLGDP
ncbi:hypothetical protein H6F67_01285 [Microcoleus sp. FACHB-1515]|nr:hypothetical protein [Microcoleus sp. FACHB-1515]